MLFRLRNNLALYGLVLSFCWVVYIFFMSEDQSYSINDFDEDMSKLYSDIGFLSQKRGDFLKAVQFYEIALNHRPDDTRSLEKLEFCLKKAKKSFKKLT